MPIFIEAGEYREGSTMPQVAGAIVVDGLESMTGSDCMVSPSSLPATKPDLIREHIEAGAILCQIKRGLDIAASVGTRLTESLIRMREIAPLQSQRVLLFVGTLACDHDGRALIDGRRVSENVPGVEFWNIQAALDSWNDRGGVVVQLSRIGLLADWLTRRELRLKEYAREPRKLVYPDKPTLYDNDDQSAGLQIPVKIADWRVPLSFLIGPKKTQIMWEACKGHGGFAFYHLSNPSDWPHLPKGVYESDAKKFRERMCLRDGEILTMATTNDTE